jgi:hypothetical protein
MNDKILRSVPCRLLLGLLRSSIRWRVAPLSLRNPDRAQNSLMYLLVVQSRSLSFTIGAHPAQLQRFVYGSAGGGESRGLATFRESPSLRGNATKRPISDTAAGAGMPHIFRHIWLTATALSSKMTVPGLFCAARHRPDLMSQSGKMTKHCESSTVMPLSEKWP